VACTGAWTYDSADAPTYVISVDNDQTTIISVGMKLRLTHAAATKYFIVTAVGAFGAGVTLITVYGGTDYTLAAGAITVPYYSPVKAPFGFPLNPAKWTVEITDVTSRVQATPTSNQYYNLGAVSISIPIGLWNTSYSVFAVLVDATAGNWLLYVTLSTANNNASDADFIAAIRFGDIIHLGVTLTKTKTLSIASKTSYYLNTAAGAANCDNIYNRNDLSKLIIRAVSAYL
jgi:hypothetical protein